jgi:hypothetical protein
LGSVKRGATSSVPFFASDRFHALSNTALVGAKFLGLPGTHPILPSTFGLSRVMIATSVGGTLTGRGGDIIIIDDPIKPQDAQSKSVREKTVQWYENTLLSRLDDKVHGAIVVVMQRLHLDDLSGHLLERSGFEHLCLPAIAERKQIPARWWT